MSARLEAGTEVRITNPYGATVARLRAPLDDNPKVYRTGIDYEIGGERGRTEGRVERYSDFLQRTAP